MKILDWIDARLRAMNKVVLPTWLGFVIFFVWLFCFGVFIVFLMRVFGPWAEKTIYSWPNWLRYTFAAFTFIVLMTWIVRPQIITGIVRRILNG